MAQRGERLAAARHTMVVLKSVSPRAAKMMIAFM
jgi:hypothetical protein